MPLCPRPSDGVVKAHAMDMTKRIRVVPCEDEGRAPALKERSHRACFCISSLDVCLQNALHLPHLRLSYGMVCTDTCAPAGAGRRAETALPPMRWASS